MFVSVIIPTHNRPKRLFRAVESVLSQAYRNIELIVVDDGSTEDLAQVETLVSTAGHQFIRTDHKGVAHARNTGLRAAKAEWICLLDSDDRWLPGKLANQVEYHRLNPHCVISQCEERWYRRGKFVNMKTRHRMPLGDAFPQSLELCSISSSSVMLRRELYQRYGLYDELLPVCEDYDLWVRITTEHPVGLVPGPLVEKFGGHSDQLSKSERALDRYRIYALLKLLDSQLLSDSKLNLVLSELRKKCLVLIKGAKKHNPEQLPNYHKVLEWVASPKPMALKALILAVKATF